MDESHGPEMHLRGKKNKNKIKIKIKIKKQMNKHEGLD